MILSRSKMGFPVPVSSWFRDQYRVVTHEYVLGERARARGLFANESVRSLVEEHERGAENHWERLWSLVNLEVWQRLFVDGETVAEATADMSRALGRRDVELPAGFKQGAANVLAPSRK